ncbi:hypothetical protein C8F01DRAFT_1257679 [Mycena amicta]|nr:hypothetical protein C8F01DRAFT_1257679 [Mycena amicta]
MLAFGLPAAGVLTPPLPVDCVAPVPIVCCEAFSAQPTRSYFRFKKGRTPASVTQRFSTGHRISPSCTAPPSVAWPPEGACVLTTGHGIALSPCPRRPQALGRALAALGLDW